MSDKPLQGKASVVTGGASGIGLAIAERLAAEGACVVIGDIQVEKGRAAAERVAGVFVEADISRRADCHALIDRAMATFGTVHVLVNVAGFQHIDPIEEFPEDRWDEMLEIMVDVAKRAKDAVCEDIEVEVVTPKSLFTVRCK